MDPQDSEVAYVALLGTLMKITNGGTGWVDLRAGVSNLKRLRIDPLRPQILNIVSAFGVTRSVNGGKPGTGCRSAGATLSAASTRM